MRIEHIAINVSEPAAMAKWYSENLGMEIVRKGPAPANAHFISDTGDNVLLEIYNNPPDNVPDYASMDPLLFHIAFVVDDSTGALEEVCRRLVSAGATIVGDVTTSPDGDEFAILRDPWGVAIQFVKRAKPMI
jgi:catechol 2,3-dioxygenase-like lactoylglutathione lyase family enzyme